VTLVCVGSIAFDSVETPFGARERMLGGSATHFSLAASFFTEVRVVGVVGEDFRDEQFQVLEERGINTEDVERVTGEKTFFWRGRYDYDLNTAHTLETQLNVFAGFEPRLSPASTSAPTLFLGNIQPELQLRVRERAQGVRFAALDSMNLWIETARDSLVETVATVDCVLLNDAEARMLAGEPNLTRAARRIREWGPSLVVTKQGEYGAALFTDGGFFSLPGYPLEDVSDPTGAGDSFAGGFVGFLAAHRGEEQTEELLRRAMVYGSVMASFNVEAFGTERVLSLTRQEIDERFRAFKEITHFEAVPFEPPVHAAV